MEITLTRRFFQLKWFWCVKTGYFARRSAVDLAYKIHGECSQEAVPLIVLHGLLGSKRNWAGMAKNLASDLNTCAVVVDARNHGESPHDSSHTYPDLASDVVKLMETLSFKRAAIIGHSMGGRTGMPDKVDRLVVVDISPVSTAGVLNDFFPRLINVLMSIKFDGVDNLSKARDLAKDAILASGVMENMEGMNFILMNIGIKSDNTCDWVCNLETLKKYFITIATFPKEEMENKKYYRPTLFIGGEKSNYIPPSDLSGIKSYFPNAELKYIANVGHNVHAEDPPRFFKMVMDFFKKNKF